MRLSLRPLAAVAATLAIASCMDLSAPAGTRSSVSIAPRFSPSASLASATLAEAGVMYSSVRILLLNAVPDTVKDTTIAFTPSSAETTLDLSVNVVPGDSLTVVLEFRDNGQVIFVGGKKVKTLPPTSSSAATPVEVEVEYAGPGATATSVTITPGAGSYSSSSNTQFTAKAFDGATELTSAPMFWKVSDETKASISASGLLAPKGQRGTIDVTATTANGVSKTIAVQLAPSATGLRVVQGALQKGAPGATLPVPVIVELVAADGQPAASAGQTIAFTTSGGAQITPASATLDASGRAQATVKLGNTPGTTYIYTATVGTFSVSWGEAAEVGPPTHFVRNTSSTLTITAGVIPNPVPTLRLADAQENSVPNQFVRVIIQQGATTLVDQPNVPVDSIGLLEVYKIAPTTAGTYTITVKANPTLSIPDEVYTVTVNPGPAAKLVFTVQPSSVVVNQTMAPAVKVEVRDQYDNLVTSASGTISIGVDAATGAGVTQTGTGSVTASGGIATFSNLKFGATKTGVKINVSGMSLPLVLSAAFNITP